MDVAMTIPDIQRCIGNPLNTTSHLINIQFMTDTSPTKKATFDPNPKL